MDSNFNVQQNNMQQEMQQSMGQLLYQQPLYQQPMMPQNAMNAQKTKTKKKKGIIIGLIIGHIMIISALVFLVYTVISMNIDWELEGTWIGENGTKLIFENDGKDDGYIRFDVWVDGEKIERRCTKYGNILEFYLQIETWSDEHAAYFYDIETDKVEIVKLTSNKLILKYEGDKYEFERK